MTKYKATHDTHDGFAAAPRGVAFRFSHKPRSPVPVHIRARRRISKREKKKRQKDREIEKERKNEQFDERRTKGVYGRK